MRAAEALAAGILVLLVAPAQGDAAPGVTAAPQSPAPTRLAERDLAPPPGRRFGPTAPRLPAALEAPPSSIAAQALAIGDRGARPSITELTLALRRSARPALSYEIALAVDASDFDRRDAAMRTPLHHASEFSRDPALIALMIGRGADVMARDAQGRTPLHAAADNPTAAAALLEAGADACEPDVAGRLALDARALERIRSEAPEAYDTAAAAFLECL